MKLRGMGLAACAAAMVGTAQVRAEGTNDLFATRDAELPLRIFDETDAQREARQAWWTHDGSEVKVVPPPRQWDKAEGFQPKTYGGFKLPVVEPNVLVPVVEIYLKD